MEFFLYLRRIPKDIFYEQTLVLSFTSVALSIQLKTFRFFLIWIVILEFLKSHSCFPIERFSSVKLEDILHQLELMSTTSFP